MNIKLKIIEVLLIIILKALNMSMITYIMITINLNILIKKWIWMNRAKMILKI